MATRHTRPVPARPRRPPPTPAIRLLGRTTSRPSSPASRGTDERPIRGVPPRPPTPPFLAPRSARLAAPLRPAASNSPAHPGLCAPAHSQQEWPEKKKKAQQNSNSKRSTVPLKATHAGLGPADRSKVFRPSLYSRIGVEDPVADHQRRVRGSSSCAHGVRTAWTICQGRTGMLCSP